MSNFYSLLYPDLIYEQLVKLDYPAIRQVCSTNKEVLQICQHDSLITKLINSKRIQYKTNYLIQQSEHESTHPIIKASAIGDAEIVDELIKRGFDPFVLRNYAIGLASENGHIKVVERLLQDERVNPADNRNEAIELASKNGHIEVVERLLQDERVNPADNNNAAIRLASEEGHVKVVERLLQDKRVNPAANNNVAIRLASANVRREPYGDMQK